MDTKQFIQEYVENRGGVEVLDHEEKQALAIMIEGMANEKKYQAVLLNIDTNKETLVGKPQFGAAGQKKARSMAVAAAKADWKKNHNKNIRPIVTEV